MAALHYGEGFEERWAYDEVEVCWRCGAWDLYIHETRGPRYCASLYFNDVLVMEADELKSILGVHEIVECRVRVEEMKR